MRFYTGQHTYYCGIDPRTQMMYVCILDACGDVVLQRNTVAKPKSFLAAIEPFKDELVVAAECMFTWYWVADVCECEGIPFVLGHALYMRAIHGGKTKNDRVDTHEIAVLLRGGMFPLAHVYPKEKRSTRDLLRRRTCFVLRRAELLGHGQNTSWQYRLEPIGRRLANRKGHETVPTLFDDAFVQSSIEANLELVGHYDGVIKRLEWQLTKQARIDDRATYDLLRSIPGVGKVLALILLYVTEGSRSEAE